MSDVGLFVRGSGTAPRQRHRWLGPALALGVLLLAGVLTLQPTESGVPYDPTSTAATGLQGQVDVLRELGVDVTVTDDPAVARGADTVLVPPLGWPRDLVEELAAAGSRVVTVEPPTRDAVPRQLGVGGIGLVDLEPGCDLLADVQGLRTSQWPGFEPEAGTAVLEQCVVRGDAAWLTRVGLGQGELVSVATLAPLVNERLVDSDAGLAGARLLAPTGAERVVVLGTPPGAPPPTLLDVVDQRWFDAAWLTLAVLAALALARGRRFGRPVTEELPVRVPSGELARAIGDLRHRAGHDARAAQELRARTLAECRRRLGLPRDVGPQVVLTELRAVGLARSPALGAALTGPLPQDADGLVATARALAELRATMRRAGPDRTDTVRPTDDDHTSIEQP